MNETVKSHLPELADALQRQLTSASIEKQASPYSKPAPVTDLRATLNERHATHGDYTEHATITQGIKAVYATGRNWETLSAHERETLDMIAHKIGRILSGNPHHHDHWHDIAGYAQLSADRNA